jgi:hypothetical protein
VTFDPVDRYLNTQALRASRRHRLRPLTSTDLIDLSFRVYQNLGRSILSGTLIPTLFSLAAVAFMLNYAAPAFFTTTDATNIWTQVGESAFAMTLALLVAGPLLLLGVTYTSIYVTHLVSDYLLGDAVDIEAAGNSARRKLGKIFWLNLRQLLIASSGLVIGILLLMASALLNASMPMGSATNWLIALLAIGSIVSGVIVMFVVVMRESLAGPAAVLEGLPASQAAKRSVRLMRGVGHQPSGYGALWLAGLLVFLLVLMIWGGFMLVLGMLGVFEVLASITTAIPFGGVVQVAIDLLPWFLTLLLVVPVWATITTLLYYERRVRLEAYDVEALAQDVWRSYRAGRFEF